MALFGCTGILIRVDTSRLVLYMSFELISVLSLRSWWLLIIIATSSREVLPALSPIPFIVTSTCLAPFITPIMVLAVAIPRSLWQCVDITALSMLGTFSFRYKILAPYSSGRQYPVVSGMFTTVAPAFITASITLARYSLSLLPASSA